MPQEHSAPMICDKCSATIGTKGNPAWQKILSMRKNGYSLVRGEYYCSSCIVLVDPYRYHDSNLKVCSNATQIKVS